MHRQTDKSILELSGNYEIFTFKTGEYDFNENIDFIRYAIFWWYYHIHFCRIMHYLSMYTYIA